jgi:CRISPR-associated protein Cas2
MRIVVSYDITDDKRRAKVAKIMEGYGYRVQYSVFECDLDDKQLKQLWQRLKPLVSAKEWESVRFYPLYSECAGKVKVLGKDLARFLGHTSIV